MIPVNYTIATIRMMAMMMILVLPIIWDDAMKIPGLRQREGVRQLPEVSRSMAWLLLMEMFILSSWYGGMVITMLTMKKMRWGENEEAFGEQGAMVGWSNYVLDAGKKLSCPTGGPEHATLHQCTENNPDKAFSGGVRADPFQELNISWIGC